MGSNVCSLFYRGNWCKIEFTILKEENAMTETLIYKNRPSSSVTGAIGEKGDLWLPIERLEETTGLVVKPEGICFDDQCIPLPAHRAHDFFRDDATKFNLTAFARLLDQPVLHDSEHSVWLVGEAGGVRRDTLTSLEAPDFTLPDQHGNLHSLSDYRGKKVFLVSWASWWGCRHDLPVWQKLYEKLQNQDFVIITVAFDTGGLPAVREWIDAANPTYPCLIDELHTVAELYNMVNVPNAVWIDESGKIVRSAEPAGVTDAFRLMDRSTFEIPREARLQLRECRESYIGALADWVANGTSSRYALSADQLKQQIAVPTDEHALAAAYFRMGIYLDQQGHKESAQTYLLKARELHPESWAMARQSMWLEHPSKSSGPAFWSKVDELGHARYYPDVKDL
jgi:peroxiredoxin